MRITNVLFVFFPHDMSGYFAREVGRSGGWLIKILREGLLRVLNPSIHHFSKKSKGWRVAKNNDLYNFSSDFYYFYNFSSIPEYWKGELVVGLNCLIRDILNAFWLYQSKLLSSFSSWNMDNFINLQVAWLFYHSAILLRWNPNYFYLYLQPRGKRHIESIPSD